MKKLFVVAVVLSAAISVSCKKEQTDAERNAEIERQVQERLAAEHQTQQQQQLDQRQADLDAREKASAEKENTGARPSAREERSESEESRPMPREPRERAISVGYSTFYNKLEPYGDWIETSDYGYVFHPREAASSRSWRPYTYGRWVYTDAGWTWISEEPYGWATYHYGRWTRLRGLGWVWVPGNQWAPAWVSWRKSSDYVGWAPLPPEARFDQRTGIHNWSDNYYDIGPDQYCFVASREFGAPRVEQTLLPSERNVTIVNQTTNVTNITYNNTTIVNEGPNYDELRSISREPVERYRLERNVNVSTAAEPLRPEVRGETVVIAAPVIAAPVANERPSTVKQTLTAAAVDLGWAAIANQEEAKKTREKMKSEAAPPPNAPPKKFTKPATTGGGMTQSGQRSASVAPTAGPTATASATAIASATATPIAQATATPRHVATAAPTATASATAIASATATPTAQATATPRRAATVPPLATVAPSATVSAMTTPVGSPTASQRRGRLLMPSTTPGPTRGAPPNAVAPNAAPSSTPTPHETFSAPTPIPSPSSARDGGKAPKARAPSVSPSISAAAMASPTAISAPSTTPVERMTKQERKEQKREERREMKQERKGDAAPTATP